MKIGNIRLGALILCIITCFVLQGCSSKSSEEGSMAANSSIEAAASEKTDKPVEQTEATEEKLHAYKNDTGKVIIKCATSDTEIYNTSFMIVSKKGTVVVADPYSVTPEVASIKPDIITVTHQHPDHVDYNYMLNECKQSIQTVENFTVKDIKVTSIAASHTSDPIEPSYPSDVIYVYEVDGLRIVHMGDIGQDKLTDEQLKKLGKIDVAIMLMNDAPEYGLEKGKNITILKQLKPSIVIPSHFTVGVIDDICKELGYTDKQEMNTFLVSKDEITEGKTKFVRLK